MKCKEITIKRWEELASHQKEGWIYRGQSDATYGLTTSLERACESWGISLSLAKKTEKLLIRAFQRRLYLYTGQIPNKKAYYEWLSLMQHHGAPTRLLDFTYSINVATYFAVEKTKVDCAVWAIDARWAVEKSKEKYRDKNIKVLFKKPIDEKCEAVLGKLLLNSKKELIIPINPFRLNERLTLQKGVFMCLGNVKKSFEENLRSLKGYKTKVKKLIIPNKLRKSAIKELYNIPVTRATLFPGLDGFAQSLSVYPPVLLMEGSPL
ncbi:MAG: FRG domain-containing protein [Planctomycetota bacterium]